MTKHDDGEPALYGGSSAAGEQHEDTVAAVSASFTSTCAVRMVQWPERRRPQPFENATLAVDGDDRPRATHGVQRDEDGDEHGKLTRKKLLDASAAGGSIVRPEATEQHEEQHGHDDRANPRLRLAHETLISIHVKPQRPRNIASL
jgi:hypothetical protein